MFQSFFPKPELFFPSVVIWSAFVVGFWYIFGNDLGLALGFDLPQEAVEPVMASATSRRSISSGSICITLSLPQSLPGSGFLFAAPLADVVDPRLIAYSVFHLFRRAGFCCHQQLAASVFDAVQNALDPNTEIAVTAADLYSYFVTFAEIAFLAVAVFVMTRFFVSHYIFRWRTAMNNYYLENWQRLRHVEGAAQRVQEDTMRLPVSWKTWVFRLSMQ